MKICPLCEGKGVLTRKGEMGKDLDRVKRIALLREKGLSLREIGAMVGLSATTVLYHLNKMKGGG